MCQSEGLVWWQDPGSAWSGLGAAGKVILEGRRSAAARPNSALVLAWLEPAFAETGQCSASAGIHGRSSYLPSAGPSLFFLISISTCVWGRVGFPSHVQLVFSRNNANTGFCLRLPEAEGGWWVRTLQQSEELPEGLEPVETSWLWKLKGEDCIDNLKLNWNFD